MYLMQRILINFTASWLKLKELKEYYWNFKQGFAQLFLYLSAQGFRCENIAPWTLFTEHWTNIFICL